MATGKFTAVRKALGLSVSAEETEGQEPETTTSEQEEESDETEEETPEEDELETVEETEEETEEEEADEVTESVAAEFSRGVTAERKRWADVLTCDEAAGKFDLAVSLLAEGMDAEGCKRVLASHAAPGASMQNRLSTTPRHSLGTTSTSEGGTGKRSADSRKRATANVNRNNRAKTTNAKSKLAGLSKAKEG